MGYIRIRVKSTGQVTEMVPDVARAMINSGMAEEVKRTTESTAVTPIAEQAVAPAQAGPQRKPLFSRRKSG